MNKAKEISALWSQIKPQIGELVRLCHEVESHAEVTADTYQRGYEAGLNDAWEAARKIWEYDTTTLKAIFGEGVMRMDWFMKFTASEAIEKIRQYEQEKDRRARIEYNFDEVKDVIETTAKEYNMSLDEIAEVLKKMGEH